MYKFTLTLTRFPKKNHHTTSINIADVFEYASGGKEFFKKLGKGSGLIMSVGVVADAVAAETAAVKREQVGSEGSLRAEATNTLLSDTVVVGFVGVVLVAKLFERFRLRRIEEEIKEWEERIRCLQNDIDIETDKMGELGRNILDACDFNSDSKIVVLLGKTGVGKSTIANRLIGDVSKDGKSGNNNNVFTVGDELESETTQLKACTKKITSKNNDNINNNNNNNNGKIISDQYITIVDTPGAYDTNNKTDVFNNKIGQFFQHSGGINMFCICLNFNEARIDQTTIDLIKNYEQYYCFSNVKNKTNNNNNSMQNDSEIDEKYIENENENEAEIVEGGSHASILRKQFYQHVAIIITNCDENNEKMIDLPKRVENYKSFLIKKLNVGHLADVTLPIFTFGKGNFDESRVDLFEMVNNNKSIFYQKYQCEKINTPIMQLKNQLKNEQKTLNRLKQEREEIKLVKI